MDISSKMESTGLAGGEKNRKQEENSSVAVSRARKLSRPSNSEIDSELGLIRELNCMQFSTHSGTFPIIFLRVKLFIIAFM